MSRVAYDEKRVAFLEDLVRTKALPYLEEPGVTSVGVALREVGGQRTDELCIRLTVERRLDADALATAGREPLPSHFDLPSGERVPTQILPRKVFAGVVPPPSPDAQRSRRHDPVQPGISISGSSAGAGTLGAIVYSRATGQPHALSCWHVFQGPLGLADEYVFQPGTTDRRGETDPSLGRCAGFVADSDGDAAIATLDGRKHREQILGLQDTTPRRSAAPQLEDRLIKSGRTTGVTRGIVVCVGMFVKMRYPGDSGGRQIGACEIAPDPEHLPEDGEISAVGDSGSLWLLADSRTDGATDVAVGLQFGGETTPGIANEYALACPIEPVLERLDVSFTQSMAWQPPVAPNANQDQATAGAGNSPTWGAFGEWDSFGAAPQSSARSLAPPPLPDGLHFDNSEPPLKAGLGGKVAIGILAATAATLIYQFAATYPILGEPPALTVEPLFDSQLASVFAMLSFVALLTERLMEMVVNLMRGSQAERRKLRAERRRDYVDGLRSWLAAHWSDEKQVSFWQPVITDQKAWLEREQQSFRVYRGETRRVALCMSASIGLWVALVGVRSLDNVVSLDSEPVTVSQTTITATASGESKAEDKKKLGLYFHLLDAFLTAGLIAGGSEGVHQVATAFTTSMEARKRENEGRSRAPV